VEGAVVVFQSRQGLWQKIVVLDPDNVALDRQSGIGACQFCNSWEPGTMTDFQGGACRKDCRGLVGVQTGIIDVMQWL